MRTRRPDCDGDAVTEQVESESTVVTEDEWQAERARARRIALISAALGFLFIPSLGFVALLLTSVTASGTARYPVTVGWMLVLFAPSTYGMVRASLAQQRKSDDVVAALARQSEDAARAANRGAALREVQAKRQEFESRLSNALDMAEDEPEVIDVIERSFAASLPSTPAELLLADNSHAHLSRMATHAPSGKPPGCGVASPDHCPAARRAQIQHFANSDHLDACPKLRGRADGSLAAVCVPVSIMGRTVGVLHATGEADVEFATDTVQELSTLANLAGARIGLLRVMADTQLQASTDSLTGLLNRRSFEQKLSATRAEEPAFAIAMADLDHFKMLNDTYGHETGDRALRLFADVLRGSFRTHDLLCRHGGEEFVIAFSDCSAQHALRALDGMRSRLDAAITVAGLPKFTVSVGVIDAAIGEDLPTLTARADLALFQAKREGRDRVIVHDAAGDAVSPTQTGSVLSLTKQSS
jgi:diguanylate cyclase (GGDEF)-like protein